MKAADCLGDPDATIDLELSCIAEARVRAVRGLCFGAWYGLGRTTS